MPGLHFAPTEVVREDLPGGGFILRSPMALGSYPDTLNDHLDHWALVAPERPFLAEREPSGE